MAAQIDIKTSGKPENLNIIAKFKSHKSVWTLNNKLSYGIDPTV